MIETVLQIENGIYPFGEGNSKEEEVKVVDIQTFRSLRQLQEKKNEMTKKGKLVESNYIIRITKIYQDEFSLHYIYEYVPYSLIGFIDKYYANKGKEILELNSKNFLKKISCELTMLISYLACMKIQLDLNINTLGITADQKVKVYMNSKCKMGHKTEIGLVAYYSQCKEKVMKCIDAYLNSMKKVEVKQPKQHQNFVIRGNRLVFPESSLNESYESQANLNNTQNDTFLNHLNEEPEIFRANKFSDDHKNLNKSSASCINPNQYAKPIFSSSQQPHFAKNINFNTASKHSTRSATKFPRNSTNSFHFGGKHKKDERYNESDENEDYVDDDNSDAKSFTHSRSVRIEFQQKIDPKMKKQRKESIKVKVTTFHEYEMADCDPSQLFPKQSDSQQSIFQHFAQRFKPQQRETQSSNRFDSYMHRPEEKQQQSEPQDHDRFSSFAKRNEARNRQQEYESRFSNFQRQFQQSQKSVKEQRKFQSFAKNKKTNGKQVKQESRFESFGNHFQEKMKERQQQSRFDWYANQFTENAGKYRYSDDPEESQFDCPITPIPFTRKQSTPTPSTPTPSSYNKKERIDSNFSKRIDANNRTSASFINLQQKVRQAKEKAMILLNKYPRLKKTCYYGEA